MDGYLTLTDWGDPNELRNLRKQDYAKNYKPKSEIIKLPPGDVIMGMIERREI